MGFYGTNTPLHDHTRICDVKTWGNSMPVMLADTFLNFGRRGGYIRPFVPPKQAKLIGKMGFYGKNMILHTVALVENLV